MNKNGILEYIYIYICCRMNKSKIEKKIREKKKKIKKNHKKIRK